MDLTAYHQNIDQIWLQIEEQLEAQDADIDCEIQGAVFTLTFPDGNQIVINKQEPLRELWLASKAGGYHFTYHEPHWLNQKGENFWDHLANACKTLGMPLRFYHQGK